MFCILIINFNDERFKLCLKFFILLICLNEFLILCIIINNHLLYLLYLI